MKHLTLTLICAGVLMTTAANAGDLRINGNSQYGCTDKDYFKKTVDMVAQNDAEAFKKVLGAGLATGVCTMFQANEPVHLAKAGFMTIKIRRQGDATEYWTNTEAVTSR